MSGSSRFTMIGSSHFTMIGSSHFRVLRSRFVFWVRFGGSGFRVRRSHRECRERLDELPRLEPEPEPEPEPEHEPRTENAEV